MRCAAWNAWERWERFLQVRCANFESAFHGQLGLPAEDLHRTANSGSVSSIPVIIQTELSYNFSARRIVLWGSGPAKTRDQGLFYTVGARRVRV